MLEALTQTPLDRNGSPLHQQLRERIERSITSQAYEPGTPLPTEQELQRCLEISRSVVRQALASLVEKGLIERQRGRGSIVARPRSLHRQADRAGGFGQDILKQGGKVRTTVVGLRRAKLADNEAAILGENEAWELDRIRFVEDAVVISMRTWFACKLFDTPTVDDLTDNSLLDWMRAQGYKPVGGRRHLQAVKADALQSERLQVTEGTPLLLLEGVTEDISGVVLERFKVWHGPQTVFDVDARVQSSAVSEETLLDINNMLAGAQNLLSKL